MIFTHPVYSLEDRNAKATIHLRPTQTTNSTKMYFIIPDEEKGRKVRVIEEQTRGSKKEEVQLIPSFDHHRQIAVSEPTDQPKKDKEGEDWEQISSAVSKAIETSNGNIELNRRNLTVIPKTIADLQYCISLTTSFAMKPITSGRRTFGRTQSVPFAPISNNSDTNLSNNFTKTQSSTSLFSKTKASAAVPLKLYLAFNNLTSESFPSEFFKLENLTVLSLRNNQLSSLPVGFGRLTGLVELNLGGNQLSVLPAEILNLGGEGGSLELLTLWPNPFIKSSGIAITNPKSQRLLSPLVKKFKIPSLGELMQRKLLGTSPWESIPLAQESFILEQIKTLPTHLTTAFQSLFSNTLITGIQPFDSASNVCYSKIHLEPIQYVEHAEERIEWISVTGILAGDGRVGDGAKEIPIRHRGCSTGCLDWLEQE